MIGYFLFGSKLDGLNSIPYRSVLPSRAFTTIGSGATQPLSFRRARSACATCASTLPSLASRNTVTGATAVVEYVSTTRVPSGDRRNVCCASSGDSSTGSPESRFTRYRCWWYGWWPSSRPTPVNHAVRVAVSRRSSSATFQSPFVTWCFSLPLVASYTYRGPQLLRWLHHRISLLSDR